MSFYQKYFSTLNKKILEYDKLGLDLLVKKLMEVKKNKKK